MAGRETPFAQLTSATTAAISVALARGAETIVAKGYGYEDLENEVPATAQTVYRLDLVEWQRALNANLLVEADTYERMITPEMLSGGTPLTYGYGLSVSETEGHANISHGGGINGFNTMSNSAFAQPGATLEVRLCAA